MNGDARRSGHKVPDCRGEWIDLTTLTDSCRVWRCPSCGATRLGGGGPESYWVEDDPLVPDRRPTLRSILLWVTVAVVLMTVLWLFTGR